MGKDDELIVDDIATPPRYDQEEIDELKREIAKLRAEKVAASRKTKEAEAELKLLKSKLAEAKLEYDILEKAAEKLMALISILLKTEKRPSLLMP